MEVSKKNGGIPNRSIVVSIRNFPGRPRGSCGPSCGELGRLPAPCAVAEPMPMDVEPSPING